MDLPSLLLTIRNRPVLGLGLAALLVAVAVLLRVLSPVSLTYVTFYPAVILATLAGGWALGVLAMLIAMAAALYFFVPPEKTLIITMTDMWNAVAFGVVCGVIIVITDLLIKVLINAHDRARRLAQLNQRLATSERQQQVLMRELSHRMKNQYSVILAMARATGQGSQTVEDFQRSFSERLHSMSRAHDLLTRSNWESVPLAELIRTELEAFTRHGRLELDGPGVRIAEHAVVNIGMALHELATNSAKHGAWSSPAGVVRISWEVADDRFRITWEECGGPPPRDGAGAGFGRVMLEKIVPSALQGVARLELGGIGLRWELVLPAAVVEAGG